MSGQSSHTARQREFYETRDHHALRPVAGDRFAQNLADRLASAAGIEPHHRVLEIGAGFGRFTFGLLEHCASVTAVDLSAQAIEALERERDARGIAAERVRLVRADIDQLDPAALGPPHDHVVGFFVLHHLADVGASLDRLAPLVKAGGALAFLEPNRWNPVYVVQVACCPDMDWREEKGVWSLGAGAVTAHYRRNGLEPRPVERFGFFPPQLYNRSGRLREFESRLERSRLLAPVLPFLLLAAHRPDPAIESVDA